MASAIISEVLQEKDLSAQTSSIISEVLKESEPEVKIRSGIYTKAMRTESFRLPGGKQDLRL
jgi:hypothetical protein